MAEALGTIAAIAYDHWRLRNESASRDFDSRPDSLAAFSHAFRTPLQVVLGYADLLHAGIPDALPERARNQVEQIRRAAAHLLQLVEQALNPARLAAPHETISTQWVDLGMLVREMALLIEPLTRAKKLRFVADAVDERLMISTDVGKVRQVLYNLLANAVKFTARGEVRLSARRGGRGVVLEIRDTGCGMSAAALARMFGPFWQHSPSAEERDRSAGLGLAISRRLVLLLGGDIAATSIEGEGTIATVTLPQSYRAPQSETPRPSSSENRT
jgi:signal transduction histidine kinase